MARKSSVARLPPHIRRHIEKRLTEGQLTLDALIAELQAKFPTDAGALPSRTAVHRYGQKLQQRLDAVRASSDAARILAEQFDDQHDQMSAGLIKLVQSELLESLMALSQASEGEMPPEERVQLLAQAGKNIGTLSRASAAHREFQARAQAAARKALLDEQRAQLDQLASKGGVTPQTLTAIRQALGIQS